MKKWFLGFVAMSATLLCAAQSNEKMVVINGTLNGDLKGHNKIYIYTRAHTDSTEIKDGHYSFSFPFTEVTFKMLYPEYIRSMRMTYQPFGILVAEPGTYYVTSDITKGMYASTEVKGPESVMLYRQFEKDQSDAYRKINTSLAEMYGKEWYKIGEKDANYQNLQNSNDSLRGVFILPLMQDLLKKHPDSYASAFVLSGSGRQIGSLEQKEQLLAQLSSRMKKSDPGRKFSDYIDGLKSSGIGSQVANFVLSSPQGKDVNFKDYKGKYVLVDFWASWCGPCRKSFPHMREVYQQYKNNQFEIYSISIDENKEAWLKAVKEENNPWVQSLDTKNISQKGFAVTGVPSTFLIDPSGKIVAKEVGFDSSGNSEIEKKLKQLFGDKPAAEVPVKKSENRAMKAIPMMKMGDQ